MPPLETAAPLVSIVVATHNQGKIKELNELLHELPVQWLSIRDMLPVGWSVEETGDTFEQNAWIKASAACAATGFIALADDSGLEVDALGGRPGVRSARFAHDHATDAENNAALLEALSAVPAAPRTARFRCVLALALPGETKPIFASGSCEGSVGYEAKGSNGFGYDPLFRVSSLNGRSMAELSNAEKNSVSHRGHAVRQLEPLLARVIRELCAQVSGG